MKLSTFASIFLATIVSAYPNACLDKRSSPPSNVTIASISYSGTGCPAGSVGTSLSEDKTTYTLIFDDFIASVQAGNATTNQKNCLIDLNLNYPSGYQYSVVQQTYRGFVALDKGVTALQSSKYYFKSPLLYTTSSNPFKGPISQDYEKVDNVTLPSLIWSPCGTTGTMHINSAVSVSNLWNSSGNGQLTEDSADGKVTTTLGLQWAKC
jgi:hypothetical protein